MTKYLVIIFLLYASLCFSQLSESLTEGRNLRFESISIESGLSQSNVRCILQDRQGFLWLGTQDGLNRYDGSNFVIFKNVIEDSNSISHNYIYDLAEDKDGNIWIATGGGGICKYDPLNNYFRRYTKDNNDLNLITALCIFIDSDNRIWAGTYLTGLSKYNPESDSFVSFVYDKNKFNSIPSNIITSIYEDSDKNLWLGSADAGLIFFDRKDTVFKKFNSEGGLASNYVNSICEGSDGNILIGTQNGLSIFDKKTTFTNYYHNPSNKNSLTSNNIKCLFRDRNGNIIIGTEDAGFSYFIPELNTFYNYHAEDATPFSISDNSIFSIFEDRSGIIWVGTNRGLCKTKNSKNFNVIIGPDSKDPLSGKNVWSVLSDEKDDVWVATDHGLFKIDLKTDKVEAITGQAGSSKIENKIVYSLSKDEKDNLWIGTNSGLSFLNKSTKKISTYSYNETNDSSLYNIIRSIYIDGTSIWIGTSARGIVKFDKSKKKFTPFNPSKNTSELLNKYVLYQTFKDSTGDFWFCTTFGLFKYNPNSDELVSAISTFDEKSQNYTKLYNQSLCLLSKGSTFWIGTSGGGLVKYKPGRGIIKRYTEQDGLSNNVVYGILSDNSGNLWLSTNRGISKFDIIKESFKNYFVADGLPSDEFNVGAYFKSKDGSCFFGSINGLVSFIPDNIKVNNYVLPIAITAFKVFDMPYLNKLFFAENETIELSYSDNYFTIEFAGLDFTNPEKNKYAFILKGFDNEWNYSGNRRIASYTNVDPGEYVFSVKGANNDGVWNEKEATIKIIILPPFYNTWWAHITYILLFFCALLFVRHYELKKRKRREAEVLKEEKDKSKLREAQLRAEKAELMAKAFESEKEIEKQNIRTKIASDLHDEIGSNLSSIGLLSSILIDDSKSGKIKKINDLESINKLLDINSAAKSSAESIRDIVWFTNPMTDQLNSLVTRMTETAAMMLRTFNHNIVPLESSFTERINPDIKRNIYLIFKETLNNIIKHSKAEKVKIFIDKEQGNFILLIEDNGIGFDELSVKKGNGLKNLKTRSKQINGELKIFSTLGKGTRITLKVPL
ncbi:MAG TPA: two-component regulator propeller domain-containing protein [Ignavibacteriaceae bacterium]|nr:two-component regulator propeller domain-containing protein [Ignavibacteriaceae bacterium]